MKKGNYLTKGNAHAIVAQVVSTPGGWMLRGAIKAQGCLCIHIWDIGGRSLTGQFQFDLAEVLE